MTCKCPQWFKPIGPGNHVVACPLFDPLWNKRPPSIPTETREACARCNDTKVIASTKRDADGELMELPCPEQVHWKPTETREERLEKALRAMKRHMEARQHCYMVERLPIAKMIDAALERKG